MFETKNQRIEKGRMLERIPAYRLVGIILFPVALFSLLSLLTYNWRDIVWLCSEPQSPAANLFGFLGAWSAFIGFSLFGAAVWALPILTLLFSLLLIYGQVMKVGRRALWMLLAVFAFTSLVQFGSKTLFFAYLKELNLLPNAGGAVGYWIVTCFLERWLSLPVNATLLGSILALSLVMAIGPRALWRGIKGGCVRFFSLFRMLHTSYSPNDGVAEEGGEPGKTVAPDKGGKESKREAEQRFSAEQMLNRRKESLRERQREAREAQILAQKEKEKDSALRKRLDAARREAERANVIVPPPPPEGEVTPPVAEEEPEPIPFGPAVVRPESLPVFRSPRAKEGAPAVHLPTPVPVPAPVPVPVPAPAPAPAPVRKPSRPSPGPASRPQPVRPQPPRPVDPPGEEETGEERENSYVLPPDTLLNEVPAAASLENIDVTENANILVSTLAQFHVPSEIVAITPGPVVTRYELRPARDVKVDRIQSLSSTIQMALAAKSLRIQAPIPGKNAVGIEIPNLKPLPVTFGELVRGDSFKNSPCEIPLVLGKDLSGKDMIYDLAQAPHLLVAGSTGSGKSVCLNSIITGLLMSRTPEQLRLILIDPKRVEFTQYNALPHLLVPVINDAKKVSYGLRWALKEMENRLKLLQKCGCRNIAAYNQRKRNPKQEEFFEPVSGGEGEHEESLFPSEEEPDTLPYIVIIFDEVADIMASAHAKEVEPAISRLAALARAVGIHLILATQRPSVDVITGTIKSNIMMRIAFKVSQANDSRTILDCTGAEDLIGRGDMLISFKNDLIRGQGAWLDDDEIGRVVDYVKSQAAPCYHKSLADKLETIHEEEDDIFGDAEEEKTEEADAKGDGISGDEKLVQDALDVIRRTKRASTTQLQRRLRIGYTRAARIMDLLEERGFVGPQEGAGAREILVDLDKLLVDQNAEFDEQDAIAMNEEMAQQDSLTEDESPPYEEGGEEPAGTVDFPEEESGQ